MKNNKEILLSIVVPCFNEQDNIPIVLRRFKRTIKGSTVEVIMVNNGSTDNTGQAIKDSLKKHPFARMVTVKKNIGYGYGILQGLKACKGKYLGFTHADLQTDPADVMRALEIIHRSDEEIFIKGRRVGRGIFDRAFSLFMGIYVSCYLGKIFTEINAQPTIFPRSLYRRFKNPPKDFSLDLYIYFLAKENKLKIRRFPVNFPKRIHGHSSWNSSFSDRVRLSSRAIKYTKELKKRLYDLCST